MISTTRNNSLSIKTTTVDIYTCVRAQTTNRSPSSRQDRKSASSPPSSTLQNIICCCQDLWILFEATRFAMAPGLAGSETSLLGMCLKCKPWSCRTWRKSSGLGLRYEGFDRSEKKEEGSSSPPSRSEHKMDTSNHDQMPWLLSLHHPWSWLVILNWTAETRRGRGGEMRYIAVHG